MRDPGTGGPHTSHTTNPVPVLLMGGGDVGIAAGRLADISPTLLDLMGLQKPLEMTGDSLLRPHMSSSSTKVGAPTGITMNSWRSTLLSACLLPLRCSSSAPATGRAGTTTIGIEWEVRRLGRRPCHGHRYAEDGVGTQLGFGRGAVESQQLGTRRVAGWRTQNAMA
jgi:hypothetical protein